MTDPLGPVQTTVVRPGTDGSAPEIRNLKPSSAGRSRWRRFARPAALLLLGGALALTGTWALDGTSGGSSVPAPSTAGPTGTAPGVATGTASATTTDTIVCGDLDRLGRSFYQTYYVPLMRNNGQGTADPIQLAASAAVVSTIGAPGGQIDGSITIAQATAEIRGAASTMVRDAGLVAQGAASSSIYGGNRIPSLTPILSSFTSVTLECTKAGYRPSWFDPQELRSG